MAPVISVEHISKRYRIGTRVRHNAIRDVVDEKLRALVGRRRTAPDPKDNFIWALKDVSFDIEEGDVVGIIGRNGAGKSTILKILSRITEPTSGIAKIRGRISTLLEVGTGFSGELSGRENVFLNGAILGMKNTEIHRRFDEIVAFAEVEKFIDTPVKHYSSGMYMRLAFAVAAHLEPDILIVDEVLAVGDAEFQKKCLGKMEQVGKEGRTVLFVSHNMGTILSLCSRCLLLQRGELIFHSSTHEVVRKYLHLADVTNDGMFVREGFSAQRDMLVSAEVMNKNMERQNSFDYGDEIRVLLKTNKNLSTNFGVEMRVKNSKQELVGYASSWVRKTPGENSPLKPGDTILITMPRARLAQDTYYLDFICRIPLMHHVDNWWDSVSFTITNCRPQGSPISIQSSDYLGSVILDDVVIAKTPD